MTYAQLHREVCMFANGLRRLGLVRGDRAALYLPLVIEAVVAMLACARLGLIHSVVFGGFTATSLAGRINDCQAKLVITSDGGLRRGKVIRLKEKVDTALQDCESVESVVVVQRFKDESAICGMTAGRDHWYHDVVSGVPADCPPEQMDAEDILFILYTSGTTGNPKGVVHTTGGYSVGTYVTTKYVFDLRDEDVFWCTADIGWITGHSYVVYGPLQCGATVLIYEGAPNWPGKDRFWDIIERHGVTFLYTAPTAIRTVMKWGGEFPAAHDLSSLRLLGTVGEPINPEAWIWYHKHIGGGRCPIVDTWWQTETGSIVITTLPGAMAAMPGYAGKALPGYAAAVLDEQGNEVPVPAKGQAGGSGLLALTKPWPSMLRTIWGDDERYVKTYFEKWKDAEGKPRRDLYFAGDGAKRNSGGYYMILGRVDDVLNVSGHRIGTMEVESALVDHPAVAEAAVVGRAHEIKGQAIVAFVTLVAGRSADASGKSGQALSDELRGHVAGMIGGFARPEEIIFTADLPKTKSGKIMRRLLRDIAEGRDLGDTATLDEAAVVAELREKYAQGERKGDKS